MFKNIIKNKIYRNILTLLTGTTIAQAIPIAISPILTRVYTPDDFGLLALYLSITSIIAVVITARYELSIMLPENDEDAINLLSLSIIISAILSTITLVVVMLWGKPISIFLGNEKIYKWLFFVPISLFFTGVYQAFNYWSNRKQQYQRIATNRVGQSLSVASINLVLGPVKKGAFGLIVGNMLAQLTFALRLCIKSIKTDKISFSKISFSKMLSLAKRYDQFPKVSIWSGLLNNLSVQSPVFILSAFFPGTVVGWYSLSNRVLNLPMSVIGGAVGQVFFQSSSQLKNKEENLKILTYNTYRKLLLIGLIPMSIIFSFGDILFGFIFGSEWIVAGEYARVLSLWLLLVFVSSPLSLLFTVLEKETTSLLFNILIFISRIVSLLIGALIIKEAFITIVLFSVSGVLFWLWHCVYILKLVKIPYLRSITYTLSTVSLSFGLSLIIRYLILNNIW